MSNRLAFRIGFAVYSTTLFSSLIWAKGYITDQLNVLWSTQGHIDRFSSGLLASLGGWAYSFGLVVCLLVLFLPQIMRKLRRIGIHDGAYQRALTLTACFGLTAFLGWLCGDADALALTLFCVVGALLGVIEGYCYSPTYPIAARDATLSAQARIEILKSDQDRWWKGTQLFMTIFVVAVAGWALNAFFSIPESGTLAQRVEFSRLNALHVVYFVLTLSSEASWLLFAFIRRMNVTHQTLEAILTERRRFPSQPS